MTPKHPGAQDSQHHHPKPPARAPWWKRPLVWVGTVIGLFVGAIATAFGTGVGQGLLSQISNHNSADGPPVKIYSAQYESPEAAALSFAFPEKLTQQQAATFNSGQISDFQNYMARVTALNGAWLNNAAVQIVLKGNAKDTVVITGIQLVKKCTAPLSGALLYSPPAGPVPDLGLGFNLDQQFPTAESATLPTSYFLGHTISLTPGETQSLIVGAETKDQSCQFTFKLMVDTDKGQVALPITNHGKPFAVTAVGKVSSYKIIYAGGVLDPGGDDAFAPMNAKTFARLTLLP